MVKLTNTWEEEGKEGLCEADEGVEGLPWLGEEGLSWGEGVVPLEAGGGEEGAEEEVLGETT